MRSFLVLSSAAFAVQAANPIRKVVNLLQDMKQEIEAEGDKESDLYKKFMCFCKGNTGDLSKAAEEAAAKIEDLKAKMSADKAEKEQLQQDLKRHKADRASAKQDLATATELRAKEHAEYNAESGDTKSHIDALNSAIPAIEKGMGGSFLQTSAAADLKALVRSLSEESAPETDREAVMAFLEQSKDYVPASGQIVGILKNMKDEMDKSLGGIVSAEEAAVKAFKDLKAAKEREIAAASSAVESKTERAGKLAVAVVQAKAGIDNATAELNDAEKFKAELSVSCKEKTGDWEERSKTRAQEIAAIGEAISVLNDDDALDIFKSTLPSPKSVPQSFLQTRHAKSKLITKARSMISSIPSENNPAVSLLQHTLLATLKSKKVDFSKVLKMIDDMVELLKKEQNDDESHRDWCNTEFDTSADEKKTAETKIASLESTVSDVRDGINALKEEIAELTAKINALDKTVAEATAQREQEHADYLAAMQLSKAAQQLIFKAKNRLQKFYNPAQYVKPKERELTAEQRILVANGQEIEPEEQQFIAGTTQTVFIQMHHQSNNEVAPPVQPETYGAYKKKGQKGNSVVALMDMLAKELEKDAQEAEHSEKTARKEYNELVADAQESRQQHTKSITTSNVSKSELEGQLDEAKNGLIMTNDQLTQVKKYIAELHGSCDFILASFEERRAARTNEVEGLKNAKAVLSGADYN